MRPPPRGEPADRCLHDSDHAARMSLARVFHFSWVFNKRPKLEALSRPDTQGCGHFPPRTGNALVRSALRGVHPHGFPASMVSRL